MKSQASLVKFATFVMVLLMVASLFIGGAQPQAVGLFAAPWDKLVHAIFFFVMTFLLIRFVGVKLVLAIIFAALVGVADELHQSFLPGRQAGWDDLLADMSGILLAVLLFRVCARN